jgi:hypothetical protein
LTFFVKSLSIDKAGRDEENWADDALALYLLNPATLYFTVLQGYNSIIQTAYLMPALYLLLRGRTHGDMPWAIRAGRLETVDGPGLAALLTVRRPRMTAVLSAHFP